MAYETPIYFDIESETLANEYYREVIYTSPRMQVVLMSLLPHEDIPWEVHEVDQFVRVEGGSGTMIIDQTGYPLKDGAAGVIPAGHQHYFLAGERGLKLYLIYAPPEHSSTRIEMTDPIMRERRIVRE